MFILGLVVFCGGLYYCIGLNSRDELEQAALLPFADDALAARNMTAATGRVCERVMEPLAELVACPRASRWDA